MESTPIRVSKIDFRVIALIFGITIGLLIFDYKYEDYVNAHFTITDVVIILSPLVAGIFAVIVAKRYWSTGVLGKTYLALGIALLFYFIANVIYSYLDRFEHVSAYPSVADFFWVTMYPFLYYHLVVNIKFFKKSVGIRTKIWMAAIIIGTTVSYLVTSLSSNPTLDFGYYLGLYYVVVDAGLLSLSILAALVFRNSVLGKVWLLLVVGFLVYSIADYWYYDYLTLVNQYTDSHPVNVIWVLAWMIIAYALYKHRKTL